MFLSPSTSKPADPAATAVRRPNPIVRLLASIKFGMTVLTLILAYACVLSAMPQVRGAVELTEMAAFHHWLFAALIALFCVSLSVATWTRIRWNLTNAGVLTVHLGLLILIGGSWLYFWNKVEGDVLLMSPRVELWTISQQDIRPLEGAMVLAEAGRAWEQNLPAFGGRVRMEVLETKGEGLRPVQEARIRVLIGDDPPREFTLSEGDQSVGKLNDRLAIHLRTFEPVTQFFDKDHAALYWRPLDRPEAQQFARLDGLPLYRERFIDDGTELRDVAGRTQTSKRLTPHLALGPIRIPTGWFESWRMPLEPKTPGLPFDVRITGYLPYIRNLQNVAVPGGDKLNPAINFTVSAETTTLRESLFALDPRMSLLTTRLPVEFRWVNSAAELDEVLRPLAGAQELEILVREPAIRQAVPVLSNEPIHLEGTPYVLTVEGSSRQWPLVSPGYEGAVSPALAVSVRAGDRTFTRTVIQRFPELSQDIDEKNKRHPTLDSNLVLRYRSAPWMVVAAGPQIDPVLAVFQPDGSVQRTTLRLGAPAEVDLMGLRVAFHLQDLIPQARLATQPLIEPVETRRPNMGRETSAIRLELTGRDSYAGWKQVVWAPFSQYPDMTSRLIHAVRPIEVVLPDGRRWELIYSRVPHALGGALVGRKLVTEFFPGREQETAWHSYFIKQSEGGEISTGEVYTNGTDVFAGWTLFQASAPANDDWSWTILGVGNRQGIWTMVLGSILITIGSLYAFYVKPVLIRRRQLRALARAGMPSAGSAAAQAS